MDQKRNKTKSQTDILSIYLREVGRIPMLTNEQEMLLGKQVQQMIKIVNFKKKLTSELSREPTLTELSKVTNLSQEVLLHILNQGQKAKQKMIKSNLRLVVSIAKMYQRRNLDLLDLIQEGSLGLERGVEKFDPTKGYRFSTYAYWWIRQSITRAIAQQGRTIRLPIHVFEKLNKIKHIQHELSQKLGRVPTYTDIAEALSLQPNQIREYFCLARQPKSLELRIGSDQDTELQEMLEDETISPFSYAVEKSLHQDIHKLLSKLPHQQQQILNLRFGLTDAKGLSLEEVGRCMGVSRERVRQIEQQALKNLRRYAKELENYLAS